MLQLVLYGLLAILVAGGLFAVAARFLPAGEQIAPPMRDEPPWDLPAGRNLQPTDVDAVRLPVALRGYRFAETDLLLDRLAGELRARDDEIARLRGGADPRDPAPTVPESTETPRAQPAQAPPPAQAPAPAQATVTDGVPAENPYAPPPPDVGPDERS